MEEQAVFGRTLSAEKVEQLLEGHLVDDRICLAGGRRAPDVEALARELLLLLDRDARSGCEPARGLAGRRLTCRPDGRSRLRTPEERMGRQSTPKPEVALSLDKTADGPGREP